MMRPKETPPKRHCGPGSVSVVLDCPIHEKLTHISPRVQAPWHNCVRAAFVRPAFGMAGKTRCPQTQKFPGNGGPSILDPWRSQSVGANAPIRLATGMGFCKPKCAEGVFLRSDTVRLPHKSPRGSQRVPCLRASHSLGRGLPRGKVHNYA